MSNSYSAWLATAQAIITEASPLLHRAWGQAHTVHNKGVRNIVTESDVAVEQLVLQRLREHFPDHAITSEEAGAQTSSAKVRWILDPLDGTTNFSRDMPLFCISLAAVVHDEPVVGIIHDPLRGHTFAALRGGGTTLNGQALHTSGITHLHEAMFAVDWPRDETLRRTMHGLTGKILARGRTLRALGTAALAMTYVATGWLDVYAALSLSAWDQAAAGLLVQEAGGCAATLSGAPWTIHAPDPLFTATPQLLTAFRRLQSEENDA